MAGGCCELVVADSVPGVSVYQLKATNDFSKNPAAKGSPWCIATMSDRHQLRGERLYNCMGRVFVESRPGPAQEAISEMLIKYISGR